MQLEVMVLNERLKKVRKHLGLTQEELGTKIGLTKSGISAIESGDRAVNDKHIKLLNAAFNVNENWLRTGEGDMFLESDGTVIAQLVDEFHLDEIDRLILESYVKLSEESRKSVKEYVMNLSDAIVQEQEKQRKKQKPKQAAPSPYVAYIDNELIPFRISEQKVSAGTGVHLYPDDFITEFVPRMFLEDDAEFGIPVSGDSMEPDFVDGEIVVIGKEHPRVGEVGVFIMDGEGYLKKLGENELISLNDKYAPIPIDESIRSVGKVIGFLDPANFESWNDLL